MKHVLVGQSAVKRSKVLLSNIYSDIFCSKTNMNATRKKKLLLLSEPHMK